MSGEAPEEVEQCWTCGGDWDICHHDGTDPESAGEDE